MRLNLQLFAVSTSIVDYLKSQGQDSSYAARKRLAQNMGISNYTGTPEQNTQLLKQLQSGSTSSKARTNTATNQAQSNPSAKAPVSTKISNGNVKVNGVDQGLVDVMNSRFGLSNAYYEAENLLKSQREQLNRGKTSYTEQLDNLMTQIQNRDKFEYDVESDMLFQQYISSMMGSGKTAMQDTMGQAAMLTGGYGSSYSQSVGNQAYNQYIQDAYANLPEYYELALQAYQMEGDEMYQQLAMLSDADAREYERLLAAYDVNNDYVNTLYGQEYQKWADEVTNATNLAGLQNSDYWANKNFIESQRQFDLQLAASQSKASSGNKNPSETQYKRALEAYNKAGSYGLEQYLSTVDEELQDALMDYALEHGIDPVTSMTSKLISGLGKIPQYLVGGK